MQKGKNNIGRHNDPGLPTFLLFSREEEEEEERIFFFECGN